MTFKGVTFVAPLSFILSSLYSQFQLLTSTYFFTSAYLSHLVFLYSFFILRIDNMLYKIAITDYM